MNGGGRQSQERENSILICKVLTGIKTIRVAVSVMVRPEPQKKQDQGDCGDYSPNAIARLYSFSPFPTLFDECSLFRLRQLLLPCRRVSRYTTKLSFRRPYMGGLSSQKPSISKRKGC